MYIGVLNILLGEVIVFSSTRLFGYALIISLGFHLFVIIHEEPALRKERGQSANCPRNADAPKRQR